MSNVDKNYEDFLKSLQEDNGNSLESFPFNEDFDIESFIKTTEAPAQEPIQAAQTTPVQTAPVRPAPPTAEQINKAKENEFILPSDNNQQVNFETAEDKNYSIKRLEEKLSDLQQRFNEANTAKEEESAFAAELNKVDEDDTKTEPVKSDEEFFSNISTAIQNLKGSLDNIVNTRLHYEENLIRQDQTLIARLKEKTTRLKAINLALNSEVKRSRSEKLEYLRRSAEQTKELLSLRMQLSHAEERTKQGDFKVSGLEQQITVLTQEKNLLDEEISKIRQEKLNYLQSSTEQTRNIMQLRHQLATKEEALKQEEVKTNFLEQQLKTVEAAHQALQKQQQNSEIQKSEAEKTLLLQREEINSLTNQLTQSRNELAQKSQEATDLRQQLLNLQLSPEQNKNDLAAFTVKQEEILAPLKSSQQEHEQKIAFLRTEQSAELQRLRTKALQEENILRAELQKAEAKYFQEESLVNSLKTQIINLENNLRTLEQEKSNYKNESEGLAKELDSIKKSDQSELVKLREKLQQAQNSYDRQQELYNNLETQYRNAQREKYYLSEEIKKAIMQRDNALLENERYLTEIEKLKNAQNNLTKDLKEEIQKILASKNQIARDLYALKQNKETPAARIQQSQSYLQEKDSSLELLKSQMAALLSSKENTDKALLEAREEKFKLLKQLEAQTRQLNTFQLSYQNEIVALRQEKMQAQLEAETKIKNLQEKLIAGQNLIYSLNQQLKDVGPQSKLEEEKAKAARLEQELEKAKKVFNQDTVLLGELKNQYSKLQDRNEILEQELFKAKEENELIEQECQSYKAQVADLSKQLSEVKAELKQGQEFTKKLSAQINKLKTVNVALNAALKQMQEQKIEALNTTAQQTRDILELREQLKRVQADPKSLNFTNGTISVSAENEMKIKSLEEELKRVSEVCMTQVQEINKIKTDNSQLKTVAEEKMLLQNRLNALQRHFNLMSEELETYKNNTEKDTLMKAKATALTVQLERVSQEKDNLKNKLEAAQAQLREAAERERKTSQELEALRQALSKNSDNIFKLKEEIAPLMQTQEQPKAPVKEEPTASTIKNEREELAKELFADTKNDIKDVEEENTSSDYTETSTGTEFKNNGDTTFQRDILEDYENDEIAEEESTDNLPFLGNQTSEKSLEEVYLPEQEIDLENLFKEDENSNTSMEVTEEENGVIIEDVRPTDVNAKTATSEVKEEKEVQVDENTYTDHSIRRSVISRRQHVRNPITTFRKDEEYSDFLKKTKSLFYRIKWSLFKD